MAEKTRLEFGVKTSELIEASKKQGFIGTTFTKSAKVLALGAVLQGAPIEDTAVRTGVGQGTLARLFTIVNGKGNTVGTKRYTASKISEALHALAWSDIIAEDYDAVLSAALLWDDMLAESKSTKSKKEEPLAPIDLRNLIFDSLMVAGKDGKTGLDRHPIELWESAVADAFASIETALATAEEATA